MDRHGTADGRAGGGQDVTFGLAGGLEAPDSTPSCRAPRASAEMCEPESGGGEALRMRVLVSFHHPAGNPASATAALVAARQQPPSQVMSTYSSEVETLSVRTYRVARRGHGKLGRRRPGRASLPVCLVLTA
jgi:hypothetical protein